MILLVSPKAPSSVPLQKVSYKEKYYVIGK